MDSQFGKNQIIPELEDADFPKCWDERMIGDLDIEIRTFRLLRDAGIDTIGDLISISEKDLLCIRGFGKKCLEDVENALKKSSSDRHY